MTLWSIPTSILFVHFRPKSNNYNYNANVFVGKSFYDFLREFPL